MPIEVQEIRNYSLVWNYEVEEKKLEFQIIASFYFVVQELYSIKFSTKDEFEKVYKEFDKVYKALDDYEKQNKR